MTETIDENLHLKTFKYRPHEVGIYNVNVLLGEKHIGNSPYKVRFRNISANMHTYNEFNGIIREETVFSDAT